MVDLSRDKISSKQATFKSRRISRCFVAEAIDEVFLRLQFNILVPPATVNDLRQKQQHLSAPLGPQGTLGTRGRRAEYRER